MPRTLAGVAAAVHGELLGADASFGAVSTDSRRLGAGALFVALRGERFDGNAFIGEAQAKGAVGALVAEAASVPMSQVRVADTRVALGQMAAAWRSNFDIPVVAVTGSNGKTTVKELIAGIIRVNRTVCVTEGNLNNDIGVPLTLMRLGAQHEALVVELGANHAGEIAYLAGIARPTVGVITNANAAHLEGFHSLAGVASAKGELLDHLPRAGTAVLNADDAFYADWRARSCAESVIAFGFTDKADCRPLGEPHFGALGSTFTLQLPGGETVEIALPLLGRHNVVNALAAAAAAQAIGARPADIVQGLEQALAVGGRLRALPGRDGAVIVDDSYNANPASVRSALDYLAGLDGRRVLVLGNMAELGPRAGALHHEIGEYARGCCDLLVAVGDLAAEAARGFGAEAKTLPDIAAAERVLVPMLAPGVTVLVKGSRVAGLDRLVRVLRAPVDAGGDARC